MLKQILGMDRFHHSIDALRIMYDIGVPKLETAQPQPPSQWLWLQLIELLQGHIIVDRETTNTDWKFHDVTSRNKWSVKGE